MRMRWLGVGLVLIGGCGGDEAVRATAAQRAYCRVDADEVEARVEALLREIPIGDKFTMTRGEFPADVTWLAPGLAAYGVPDLHMLDGPRGASRFAGRGTAFPVGMARGATFDPELEGRVGAAIGREVRAHGRDVLLAPTMNVLYHPRWGRAQETYGEDPVHIGAMAVGFVVGAQEVIATTAKHYAVNSIEDTRHDVDVTVDEQTLREIYLPHFERVVREGQVATIMSSYNSVNGAYCSENPDLLRDILKNEWQFQGFVMSDWGGTEANTAEVNHSAAAANAGLDLEMFTEIIYGGPLYEAYVAGLVDEATIDDMIRRQLRMRFCHQIDTNPAVADPSALETTAAIALADEAAERSMVLLRNEGAALPIARAAGVSIVVTGPLADVENIGDTGSSSAAPSAVTTALEGLVAARGAATVTHLAAPPADAGEEQLVADADVVVVVAGLTATDEGEAEIGAGDRASLGLSAAQLAWIEQLTTLSSRVVLVLEGGSAIDVSPFVTDVEALVMAWYPGVEGGSALARLLYGDANFSGRLPIVFPVAEADLQPFDNVSFEVTYAPYHGYRHLDHENAAPAFPFGFGLSYTAFRYDAVRLDRSTVGSDGTVTVEVDVTNTGTVRGRETVQLYAGAVNPTAAQRYVRELEAFGQVELDAGQQGTVQLRVEASALGHWDVATDRFVTPAGDYLLTIAHHEQDAALTRTLTVTR